MGPNSSADWAMLGSKAASTIATSIVHSKLDYCNSLFLNLATPPKYMYMHDLWRLQFIQNSLARAVTITPRHYHITPVLKSLPSQHWNWAPVIAQMGV